VGRRRPLTVPVEAGALVRLVVDRFPEQARTIWTDEDTVEFQIDAAQASDVLEMLRDDADLGFFFLADEAAVDYGPGKHFEVVYHLYSDKHPAWLRVRARVDRKDPRIPTVTHLWEGAMFHEREAYDMMGIVFEGNRDLRRIYMSPDYKSFPLRKDFILPDDAADSSAAGINPLERPETWDLSRFVDTGHATASVHPPSSEVPEATGEGAEGGETEADKSRPR
jgi:NADH-quinone oxidoreductase subunit C